MIQELQSSQMILRRKFLITLLRPDDCLTTASKVTFIQFGSNQILIMKTIISILGFGTALSCVEPKNALYNPGTKFLLFHSRIEIDPWSFVGNNNEKIFFPTLRFQNEKYVDMKHKYSGKKDEKYYWMKYPHHLEYQNTKKITIYCSFDFSTFPFDSHECNLSYGMIFFSKNHIDMMPSTVKLKKKETKLGEPSILGTKLSNEYFKSYDLELSFNEI